MEEFIKELAKLVERIKDLEAAYTRIKTMVFPTDSGRFAPPKYTTDPSSPTEGDLWYNLTTHKFRGRINGSSVDLH